MKRIFMLCLIAAITAAGCESMGENTKKGAGIGALTGAAIGGIVGHQDGHGWEGALIGGAAGAVGGGLIGGQFDKTEDASNSSGLSIEKVAEMGKNGTPDDVIIDEIKRTKSTYKLSSESIKYLKDNNVGDKVIDYMLGNG